MPALQKLAQNPDLLLRFLEISSGGQDVPDAIFLQLIPTLVPLIDLGHPTRSSGISIILCRMQELGMLEQVREITVQMTKNAVSAPLSALEKYISFLTTVVLHLASRKLLDCLAFRMMYCHVLNAYIKNIDEKKPKVMSSWRRQKVGCSRHCPPCRDLDDFMESQDCETNKSYSNVAQLRHALQQWRLGCGQKSWVPAQVQGFKVKFTKTSPEIEEWDKSRASALLRIQKMGLSNLKILLGDFYPSIMTFKPIPVAEDPTPVEPEVVDLTDEAVASRYLYAAQSTVIPTSTPRFGVPAFSKSQSFSPALPSGISTSGPLSTTVATSQSRTQTINALQPTNSNKINTPPDSLKRKACDTTDHDLHPTNSLPASQHVALSPPPPPSWLTSAIASLSAQYPKDRFEAKMRYTVVDTKTGQCVAMPAEGQPAPKNIQFTFLPRILCRDCPGKLYNPGPDQTIGNFDVHLRHRLHRERVEARMSGGKGAGGSGHELQDENKPSEFSEPSAKRARHE